MYERVNINCAEVNSTWVSGGGIYFFNFQNSGTPVLKDSQLGKIMIEYSRKQ
jgi:hypothetical protein